MADEDPTPEPAPEPRVWDDAYQADVGARVRALRDELQTVDGAAAVVRDLETVLRRLP